MRPFYYAGTQDELKDAIAAAGGIVTIVEGEVDVWSLQAMGIRNVIGIYGITNIPKDIATIFNELGVAGFVYFADNDKSGEDGASNLSTRLHEAHWPGDQDYRKFAGPGIPDKGDANDLLCHHFPDICAGPRCAGCAAYFSTPHTAQAGTQTIHGDWPRPARLGCCQGSDPHCAWALALKTSTARASARISAV